jgi:hypothetical protein
MDKSEFDELARRIGFVEAAMACEKSLNRQFWDQLSFDEYRKILRSPAVRPSLRKKSFKNGLEKAGSLSDCANFYLLAHGREKKIAAARGLELAKTADECIRQLNYFEGEDATKLLSKALKLAGSTQKCIQLAQSRDILRPQVWEKICNAALKYASSPEECNMVRECADQFERTKSYDSSAWAETIEIVKIAITRRSAEVSRPKTGIVTQITERLTEAITN